MTTPAGTALRTIVMLAAFAAGREARHDRQGDDCVAHARFQQADVQHATQAAVRPPNLEA
jgi:hypothetical protein